MIWDLHSSRTLRLVAAHATSYKEDSQAGKRGVGRILSHFVCTGSVPITGSYKYTHEHGDKSFERKHGLAWTKANVHRKSIDLACGMHQHLRASIAVISWLIHAVNTKLPRAAVHADIENFKTSVGKTASARARNSWPKDRLFRCCQPWPS